MRLKFAFEEMEFDDCIVAVPVGSNSEEYAGIIKMNETAAFIFNLLKEETTEEAIVEAIEKEYDAPRTVISNEVKKCINDFTKKGVLI